MEAKINKLLEQVTTLQQALAQKEESGWEKFFRIAKEFILPAAIAVLAYVGTQAGTRISEGQLRLAESAAADRKDEFRRTMQSKYVEVFYRDLNSGNVKNQQNALRLLRIMDTDLAQSLAGLVEITPNISGDVRATAARARQEIENFGALYGYKIGIYYYRDSPPSASRAESIKQKLVAKGFQGAIQLYPSDRGFFELVRAPNSLEVRYEPGKEDSAADSLVANLKEDFPSLAVSKRSVSNSTPSFISIFIPTNG